VLLHGEIEAAGPVFRERCDADVCVLSACDRAKREVVPIKVRFRLSDATRTDRLLIMSGVHEIQKFPLHAERKRLPTSVKTMGLQSEPPLEQGEIPF